MFSSIPWTTKYSKWKRPLGYLRVMKARMTYGDYVGIRLSKRRVLGLRVPVIGYIQGDQSRLRAMKNIHKDKRCFIICTGPSLNKLDLTKIENEITFSMNAIYLNYEKMGFEPTYYVIEDIESAEDDAKVINNLKKSIKLIPIYLSYDITKDKNTIYFNHEYSRQVVPAFSTHAASVTFCGLTVTYTILQLAFHFGCNPVYLIGLDFDYKTPKDVKYLSAETMDFESADPNHFHQDYRGKGRRYGLPHLDKNLESYKFANEVYKSYNRKIYNATVGGKLEVFERVDYDGLF